ncbi:von Willebrand factor A domain-containing protein 3A [Tupaia chinensis]|uniref:von Willebrand factor A domain-containing protein 3A n=1 Tax=Tupaia chinensis TaxID=246437 RepID=L8YDD9_TUPCH|nr:von Willebrand factor A domain-containing protein 3A [Tupaia chinensis]
MATQTSHVFHSQDNNFLENHCFNLLGFAEGLQPWQDTLVETTDAACHEAMQWVTHLQAHGGTSVLQALLARDLYTQAAEAAMEAMKGRLATKYYQKAEEAWAQMEE